jgi:hypothetical protein
VVALEVLALAGQMTEHFAPIVPPITWRAMQILEAQMQKAPAGRTTWAQFNSGWPPAA